MLVSRQKDKKTTPKTAPKTKTLTFLTRIGKFESSSVKGKGKSKYINNPLYVSGKKGQQQEMTIVNSSSMPSIMRTEATNIDDLSDIEKDIEELEKDTTPLISNVPVPSKDEGKEIEEMEETMTAVLIDNEETDNGVKEQLYQDMPGEGDEYPEDETGLSTVPEEDETTPSSMRKEEIDDIIIPPPPPQDDEEEYDDTTSTDDLILPPPTVIDEEPISLSLPPIDTALLEDTALMDTAPIDTTPIDTTALPLEESTPLDTALLDTAPLEEGTPIDTAPIDTSPLDTVQEEIPLTEQEESTPLEETHIETAGEEGEEDGKETVIEGEEETEAINEEVMDVKEGMITVEEEEEDIKETIIGGEDEAIAGIVGEAIASGVIQAVKEEIGETVVHEAVQEEPIFQVMETNTKVEFDIPTIETAEDESPPPLPTSDVPVSDSEEEEIKETLIDELPESFTYDIENMEEATLAALAKKRKSLPLSKLDPSDPKWESSSLPLLDVEGMDDITLTSTSLSHVDKKQ